MTDVASLPDADAPAGGAAATSAHDGVRSARASLFADAESKRFERRCATWTALASRLLAVGALVGIGCAAFAMTIVGLAT